MAEDFTRIFASTGTKATISDSDYNGGWVDIVGDAPPDTPDFNAVMNEQDRKLAELNSRTPSAPSITGSATFTNSTNNVSLTGIGDIAGLEVGDVYKVTGSASNDKEFTVEVITDSNNVIFNQSHAGGTTTKSLVDEATSAQ